jgi:adenylate kinase
VGAVKGLKGMFLFIGAPGSGKGSLAQECISAFGWKQLSTGNMCRKHISEQTKVGKEIDFAIKSGKLIADDLVTAMVAEWIEHEAASARGVILDGFPRTVAQAQALDNFLDNNQDWKLCIVRFIVSDETIIDRLSKRYICQNKECQAVYSSNDQIFFNDKTQLCEICKGLLVRRKDDEPESIKERLAIYHKYENFLLQFYRDKGQEIKEINADRQLSDVFRDLKKAIGLTVA